MRMYKSIIVSILLVLYSTSAIAGMDFRNMSGSPVQNDPATMALIRDIFRTTYKDRYEIEVGVIVRTHGISKDTLIPILKHFRMKPRYATIDDVYYVPKDMREYFDHWVRAGSPVGSTIRMGSWPIKKGISHD